MKVAVWVKKALEKEGEDVLTFENFILVSVPLVIFSIGLIFSYWIGAMWLYWLMIILFTIVCLALSATSEFWAGETNLIDTRILSTEIQEDLIKERRRKLKFLKLLFIVFCASVILRLLLLFYKGESLNEYGFVRCAVEVKGKSLDMIVRCRNFKFTENVRLCLNNNDMFNGYAPVSCKDLKKTATAESFYLEFQDYDGLIAKDFGLFNQQEFTLYVNGNPIENVYIPFPIHEIAKNVFIILNEQLEKYDLFFNLGVTGWYGEGKSTLINTYASAFMNEQKTIAKVVSQKGDDVTNHTVYYNFFDQLNRIRLVDVWGFRDYDNDEKEVAVFLEQFIKGKLCGNDEFAELTRRFYHEHDDGRDFEYCFKGDFKDFREKILNGEVDEVKSLLEEEVIRLPQINNILYLCRKKNKKEANPYKIFKNIMNKRDSYPEIGKILDRVVFVLWKEMEDNKKIAFYNRTVTEQRYTDQKKFLIKAGKWTEKDFPKIEDFYVIDAHRSERNLPSLPFDISRGAFHLMFNLVVSFLQKRANFEHGYSKEKIKKLVSTKLEESKEKVVESFDTFGYFWKFVVMVSFISTGTWYVMKKDE